MLQKKSILIRNMKEREKNRLLAKRQCQRLGFFLNINIRIINPTTNPVLNLSTSTYLTSLNLPRAPNFRSKMSRYDEHSLRSVHNG